MVGLTFELGTIIYANRARNIYDEDEDEQEPRKEVNGVETIEVVEFQGAKLPDNPVPVIEQQLSGIRKGSMCVE